MSYKVSNMHCNGIENKFVDMNGRSNSFITNERGQQLYCSYWIPAENQTVKALVYICHGFCEHLQWYDELAVKFAKVGLLAFGNDHIGHGKSDGIKGHISSFHHYANDVLLHCEQIMEKYKRLPCFIVGHSMGGLVSIMAAMKKPDLFVGMVLMGPLIRPNPKEATPLKTCIAKLIARVFPYCPVAYLNEKHVTRDVEMTQKLLDDPLRYRGGIKAQWSMACLEELNNLNKNFENVYWPFLILQGEKDLICDTEAAIDFSKMSSSKDKEIKIIPEAYHNLYIELPEVRKQALQDTIDWVTARV